MKNLTKVDHLKANIRLLASRSTSFKVQTSSRCVACGKAIGDHTVRCRVGIISRSLLMGMFLFAQVVVAQPLPRGHPPAASDYEVRGFTPQHSRVNNPTIPNYP